MQSHGETIRKYGHNRRPSYGKAMPVSALLMNYAAPRNRLNDSISRDGMSPDHERPPMVFNLSEVNSNYQETDRKVDAIEDFIKNEQKSTTDCSVSADNEFVFVSLKDVQNNDIETCPMTELCDLLCDNSCKKNENNSIPGSSNVNCGVKEIPKTVSANDNRLKFLSSMIGDTDASTVESESLDVMKENSPEMIKGKKLEGSVDKLISEALVRTSMMTSPAAKRRLAARKIQMDIDAATQNAEDSEYVPPMELLIYLARYKIYFVTFRICFSIN